MQVPETADVVVIGAGVIGASIACALGRRGIRAVVAEQATVASGSSGACDGMIFMQTKKPGAHLSLALCSRTRFESLGAELDWDIEFEPCGGMVLALSEDQAAFLRAFSEEQRSQGLDVRLLSAEQVRGIYPDFSEQVCAAAFSPLDAKVNPVALTLGFARSAERLGARFLPNTRVEDLDIISGRIVGVQTSRGKIQTPVVVDAAGAWAGSIAKMAGVDVPIIPRRGQLMVTDPVFPMIPCCMVSAGYIACKYCSDASPAAEFGISLEQTRRGNILMGATREFAGFDTRVQPESLFCIAEACTRVLPKLKNLQIIRAFAGLRPYTGDGLPILGPVETIEGLVIAAGHEGDGVALSPVTGDLIARLIDSGCTDIPLAPFELRRFHERD